MKIINESQRQQAIERIKKLVEAVEAYDKAVADKHEINSETNINFYSWKPIKKAKSINQNLNKPTIEYISEGWTPRGAIFFDKSSPKQL